MGDWSEDPKGESDVEDFDEDDSLSPRFIAVMNWIKGWLQETAFIVVMAVVLSVLLRTFVFQAFYVPSESMSDTLLENDRIVASKLSYRFGDIHRGDVIVFRDPSDWLFNGEEDTSVKGTLEKVLTFVGILPSRSGDDLVKRVIGLPGDKVKCCSPDGKIMINGVAVEEAEYIRGVTNQIEFSITVPEGRLFVMGDNRGASSDSRFHLDEFSGTVPIENVVGQVTYRVWPLSRFTRMAAFDNFKDIPSAG